MYLRAVHAESSIKSILNFIQTNPLGVLTTAIPSSTYPFLQSSHIPWVLDISDDPGAAAISNLDSPTQRLEHDVMVLFTGPHHHYVTSKFYTETKPATAKVVPTWNYAAVQVYGKATIYFDSSKPETSSFLSQQLRDLSGQCESSIMGYTGQDGNPEPWSVSDAPERYIEIMKKNIIGIDISIESIGGKFKMSQEMGIGDRKGVIEGFSNLGTDTGLHIAEMVKERGEMKDQSK
ncbi:hypothetical protein N7493_001897 [Penicillium malachiteum]|uniref:Transcriptional regulator n=1 Tax=Penicillium malachiteum TaxID=1324776 RepID=A0AAD6HV24_9EURO|nr:hypothetical protein N7493_001897 [Penicillium malachiteum]